METPALEPPTGSPMAAALHDLRRRALLVSGIGFFTDAYDLFAIGIVSVLLSSGTWTPTTPPPPPPSPSLPLFSPH